MRFIVRGLINGQSVSREVTVDDRDAYLLRTRPWRLRLAGRGVSWEVYTPNFLGHVNVTLGRAILRPADGFLVRYADSNQFNCRRENLVAVADTRKKRAKCTSKHRGMSA